MNSKAITIDRAGLIVDLVDDDDDANKVLIVLIDADDDYGENGDAYFFF